MSKWKIVDVNPGILDLYAGLMSFSLGRNKYVVEHEDTGERRIVYADDEDDLGQKISRGEFENSNDNTITTDNHDESSAETSSFDSDSYSSDSSISSSPNFSNSDAPSRELTFGQSSLLALLLIVVGAVSLYKYGFEKADKNVKAFLSEVFQPTKPPAQSTESSPPATRSFTHHDFQWQDQPKTDGKLHNPIDNEKLLPGTSHPQRNIPTIGILKGTYAHPVVIVGKYGRVTNTNDFVVKDNQFTFFHRGSFSPSRLGRKWGSTRFSYSYIVRWDGIVTQTGRSLYVFKPASARLVHESPINLPSSITEVPLARNIDKFTWTFVYENGRLREQETGKVWNMYQ